MTICARNRHDGEDEKQPGGFWGLDGLKCVSRFGFLWMEAGQLRILNFNMR